MAAPSSTTMTSAELTISALLAEAAEHLHTAGIDNPRAEARWLIGHALGLPASDLILEADRVPSPELAGRYREAVQRRANREPFAYVVGTREFYGRSFVVDRRVLVPRPETETLLEEALRVLAPWDCGDPRRPGRSGQDSRAPRWPLVIDVGTGSGAIACTLALEAPDAQVIACDVSPDVLVVAAMNRDRLGLGSRLALVRGSLLSWLREPADLVLANLPYIPADRVPMLMPEVAEWEPHLALDGGSDGLDLVRSLLADASRVVRPGGTILLELDPEQMTPARALLPSATATVIPDLAGLDRVLRLDLP